MKKLFLIVLCLLVPTSIWAADAALTTLTADTSPAATDIVYFVKDPGATKLSRKLTIGNLTKGLTIANFPATANVVSLLGAADYSAIRALLTDGTYAPVAQTFYIGTTQVAINRASAALTLAGITLTTPDIGAATGTSLLATGRVDGMVGVNVTTDATTISSTNNKSAYYINNGDSAAKGIYTLPTAAAGLQYCITLYSEHATGSTAVMKFQTSASGQYIALDGIRTASGGLIKSTGAAGDAACVVGISATEWIAYHSSGTWLKD